ncbi:sulfatase [Planctomycetota bacterium]|jgi:arylsulfatase A-like enzyme|nr:sulfatase [Planctomycetota bacterium]
MNFRNLCLLVVLCLAASCAKPQQPNVVLVIVDTLRSDHLPGYGYQRHATTPFLSELEGRGELQVLDGLLASSSWTKPSVATIFTGLTPAEHGVMRLVGPGSKLQHSDTLAQQFTDAGYATACVQSNFLLTRAMQSGYEQGFDAYYDAIGAKKDPHRGSTAAAVVATGQKWLSTLDEDQPWFLVLHFFDPHASFEDHENVDWADENYDGWVTGGVSTDDLREHEANCTAADIAELGAYYDEEILAVDNSLRDFTDALATWDNTVLLLTADHGEELGERGHIGHTQTLMGELVDVPLMVRVPEKYAGQWQLPPSTHGGYAMTQIYPALLNVCGIDFDSSRSLQAPDVLQTQVDFAPVRREHIEKYVQKIAIRRGALHMIADQRAGEVRMFDINADPQMQSPLEPTHPEFEGMLELLQSRTWWQQR